MLEQANADQQVVDTQQGADSVPDWIGSLPEDVRTEANLPTLRKYKDVAGISKAYIEAQKKIAQKGVLLPGEGAKEEEIKAYHKAIGVPDKPEDYGFVKPEKMPDGVVWNDDQTKVWAERFQTFGVPKVTGQQILQAHSDDIFKNAETEQKNLKKFKDDSVAELRKEWGSDFDRRLSKAAAAAKSFGGREFLEILKNTALDHHPVVIRTLEKIAARVGEHNLVDGYVEVDKPVITQNQLEAMMKDTRYSGNATERDPDFIKKVQDGFKTLYPDRQAAT